MNIYTSTDYRVIINEVMSEKKYLDKSLTFQAMAVYIRVQKPYISKVMNGRADFNSDQLYMSCRYLEMSDEETNYLLLLLEYDRCTYPERRKLLMAQIKKIQDSKRDSRTVLKQAVQILDGSTFDASARAEYYLEPIFLIVHVCLLVPRFRRNIDSIAHELFISKDYLNEILKKLVTMNIIEIKDGKIDVLVKNLHLPKDSKIISPHQQILRQRCISRISRVDTDLKKSFSGTFSANEEIRKKIEIEFNKLLGKVEGFMKGEDLTDCYQLNFDLFPWTNPT